MLKSVFSVLVDRQPTVLSFQAEFRVPTPGQDVPLAMTAYDELGALECALSAALAKEPPDVVAARMHRVFERITASMAHPRRQPGEAVYLDGNSRFGSAPGTWRILADSSEDACGCPICGNLKCQEWPTLGRLDENGALTADRAYHVSECTMG